MALGHYQKAHHYTIKKILSMIHLIGEVILTDSLFCCFCFSIKGSIKKGAVWININYLTLKSLKFYSTTEGPYKEKAKRIYTELRQAIINNILKNYEENGYIWEQYNDKTGKGQGTHPFTGWSSLVVAIMAEIY